MTDTELRAMRSSRRAAQQSDLLAEMCNYVSALLLAVTVFMVPLLTEFNYFTGAAILATAGALFAAALICAACGAYSIAHGRTGALFAYWRSVLFIAGLFTIALFCLYSLRILLLAHGV